MTSSTLPTNWKRDSPVKNDYMSSGDRSTQYLDILEEILNSTDSDCKNCISAFLMDVGHEKILNLLKGGRIEECQRASNAAYVMAVVTHNAMFPITMKSGPQLKTMVYLWMYIVIEVAVFRLPTNPSLYNKLMGLFKTYSLF